MKTRSKNKRVYEERDILPELIVYPDLRRLTRTDEQVAELLPWPVIAILFYIQI